MGKEILARIYGPQGNKRFSGKGRHYHTEKKRQMLGHLDVVGGLERAP